MSSTPTEDPLFKLTGRKNEEWIGKTPDSRPPKSVIDRLFLKQNGRCALSGKKIGPKDEKHCDHIKPLEDGGENRERNMQLVLRASHIEKTAEENSERAKTRRLRLKHHGLWPKTKSKIKSRGFPKRNRTIQEEEEE
jgi:5-methylcytosine-specific restriction protein A